jgi:hypothetical protein
MDDCDETKDKDGKLTGDDKCDYGTLWKELDGYNTSLGLADDKKYKEGAKDKDGKYTTVNNLTKIIAD